MNWRRITDLAKRKQFTLHLADWLGRGRGRMRFLDRVFAPRRPLKPDMTHWENHDLAAVWIGHATVLLRIEGLNILTDPVFFNRVGLGLGIVTGGPHRLVAPALSLQELPPIDLLLVSHAHFDHLDRPTLDRLNKKIPVITALHNAELIRDLGFNRVTELQWGEHLPFGPLTITGRQVQHWGARAFHDTHRGFNAYLIESPRYRVLYGGDTAHCTHFNDIGKVDLAIFGIGGYDPFIAAHATPEQAFDMANQVHADTILPMHHSTFRLSHEPVNEPIERLMDRAGRDADRIAMTEVGGVWSR